VELLTTYCGGMSYRTRFSPCPELQDILLPAYSPCRRFTGACASSATWDPATGHVPRGFIGAFGRLEQIELVLIAAEPGDPQPDETHRGDSPLDLLERCCEKVYRYFDPPATLYHRNMRRIIDSCYPGLDFEEQLAKTWITDAYLCSAPVEGGSVRAASWRACATDYLRPQLELLRGRVVVALGRKAQQRVDSFEGPVLNAGSVAPPGCNFKGVRQSWNAIPALLAASAR
jgi:Uracil DNA glycosylase superfamily